MAVPDRAPPRPRDLTTADYLRHGVYLSLYGLVKYLPSPLGDVLRYWTLKPFAGRLGRVRLYEGATIWFPERVHIGDDVTLNEWVYVDGFGGVEIGRGVRIAHRVTIMSSDHAHQRRDVPIRQQGLLAAPVRIEDDVWLGCGATILMGVTLGRGAIVGAGAVVTRSVAPYTVVAGVPARPIGSRGDAAPGGAACGG